MRITTLRCEYKANPLGIDTLFPRLSWQLESNERGARQTAYQIRAVAHPDDFADAERLLWDTGKVQSDASVHVIYSGVPLCSGQRIWWMVRVWDQNDQSSVYSDLAWWEMGLLNPSEWQAKWIGAHLQGGPRTTIPAPYFRTSFAISNTILSARLYITALGLFEVFINGRRVGHDVLAPGWTDYQKRVYYHTYDVSDLLRDGENAIGAILGDGWYCGNVEWRGRQFYGDQPKLMGQLVITMSDGAVQIISTDETWKTAYGPLLEADLIMGESYDARLEFSGWDQPGFDDSSWSNATNHKAPTIRVQARPSPAIRPIETLKPIAPPTEIPRWPTSLWIFDFGQNMVGRVRLQIQGKAGTTIILRHGEMLNPDGTLYTENLRTARQTDVFTLRGEGIELFEPRFTFHGFRYVEVNGFPGVPPADMLTGVVLHSALTPAGTFSCSDPLLNQLQHNILWGQKGNFLDIPTDCPQRDERLGWTGDAHVFIRTAAFNMDVASLFTKWQQDLADAQSSTGSYPAVAPLTDKFSPDGGAAWADAGIICPYTIYLCYGDVRILDTHYQSMTHFINYLEQSSRDLIRAFPEFEGFKGFGDWLSMNAETPKDLIGTAFFAYDAKIMSHIAQVLGKTNDAIRYQTLFEAVKHAFQERFVTKSGLVAGQSQTSYVLALYFDLVPTQLRRIVIDALIRDIEQRGMHLSTGFVGTPYLLQTLTDSGHLDVAYTLLQQKTCPSWLFPVTQGATTIWERWDGWTPEKGFQHASMNSFNHYAYGAVGTWLYAVVAGIDLDAAQPGYKHIILRPRPGGTLTHAAAILNSIYGAITSEWTLSNNSFDWHVIIPLNTTATAYFPARRGDQISVTEPADMAILEQTNGDWYCHLPSGSYNFRVRYRSIE